MANPVDPAAQAAPSGNPSPPTPLASDVNSPSVIVRRITTDNWKDHADLDLTLNNWQTWSKRVTLVLQASSGLHLYLLGQVPQPDPQIEPRAHSNWEINDAMIRAFILAHCSSIEFSFAENCRTCLQMWTTLQSRHRCQGAVAQIQLIQEAFSVHYSTSTPFSTTSEQLRVLNDRIWAMGAPTADSFLVILMLLALSGPDFRGVRDAIINGLSNATNFSPYTAAHIRARLDLEQQVRNAESTRSMGGEAMSAQSNEQSRRSSVICANCKNTRHSVEFCVKDGGGMAGESVLNAMNAQRDARRRQKKGSISTASDQKQPASSSSTSSSSTKPSAQPGPKPVYRDKENRAYILDETSKTVIPIEQTTDCEAHVVLITDEFADIIAHTMTTADIEEYANFSRVQTRDDLVCSLDWNENCKEVDVSAIAISPVPTDPRSHDISLNTSPFLLDTGCSTYITPEREDFLSLRPITNRHVTGVGGSSIRAVGIGSIKLDIGRGHTITLDNALYIPTSTVRLLSVARLIDSLPCNATFHATGVNLIAPSGTIIASGSHLPNCNLFRLDCSRVRTEDSFLARVLPNLNTWHRRLGHANLQSVYDMATKNLAKGMPIDLSTRPPKCDSCILGKQTRSSIPSVRVGERSSRRMGIIWIDLTGLMAVESRSHKRYLMNLVDDCTVYPWTFPLRNKSDALPTLQAWTKRIEAETGERVIEFRFDGGELDSNALRDWCDEHGYRFSLAAPHTSAHIGRVERMHRTIMNKARSMRLEAGLPAILWDEFALTASYLSARTFSQSINSTPYKAWHKHKPDLSHLCKIGCCAFVLVQDHHNPKIYAQSFECMLIGYASNAKAYRLYHRDTGRIIQSYHVEFIESHQAVPLTLFPGQIASTKPPACSHQPSHASIEDKDDCDAPCLADPNLPLMPILVPSNKPMINPTPPSATPAAAPPLAIPATAPPPATPATAC